MENIEWKDDPSPLSMMHDGESAKVRSWELRVDRHVPWQGFDGIISNMRDGMTQKERDLLDRLHGIGEDQSEIDRQKRMKEADKTHPIRWKVNYVGDGSARHFTHMGGMAKDKAEGKKLAEKALTTAMIARERLREVVQ